MDPLGVHYLVELAGCPAELLNDIDYVRDSLLDAARKAQATIVSHKFNMFNPHGVSGFVVIAESHISIHTWPELGYAAVDIFTCGHFDLTEKAAKYLVESFKPQRQFTYKLYRGINCRSSEDLLNSDFSDPSSASVVSLVGDSTLAAAGVETTTLN